MSLYELEIGWAETANQRRYLHWELLASEDVHGVFHRGREDSLTVLFSGDRSRFDTWASALAQDPVA